MEPITSSLPSYQVPPFRLILVEDSDADAFLIAEAARELSRELNIRRFKTVTDAIAGMSDALREDPEGVLLDLNLPSGSGLDVLRHIRQSELSPPLRVVIMTSSISGRDREAAEALGIEGYLLKPNEFHQFVAVVAQVLHLFAPR
jgi:CheY-like chemotaxis protein